MKAPSPRNTRSGVTHQRSERLVCPNERRGMTMGCRPRAELSAETGVLGWDISVTQKLRCAGDSRVLRCDPSARSPTRLKRGKLPMKCGAESIDARRSDQEKLRGVSSAA